MVGGGGDQRSSLTARERDCQKKPSKTHTKLQSDSKDQRSIVHGLWSHLGLGSNLASVTYSLCDHRQFAEPVWALCPPPQHRVGYNSHSQRVFESVKWDRGYMAPPW